MIVEPFQLPRWAAPLETVCAAIAALLAPHAEVALHDLASDTIVGLWNPFPGRAVGDPSLLDELPASWRERPVQGPYRKVLADGSELSAVSAVVRDTRGRAQGLVCVNLDRGPLIELARLLAQVAAPVVEPPPELFARDWREQIALTVDMWCREQLIDRRQLTREQRGWLVAVLEERGLFATRRAADHAARALGVSRATVYALLKEVRGERQLAGVSP
jgi:predicted transcriptional regulator YheO